MGILFQSNTLDLHCSTMPCAVMQLLSGGHALSILLPENSSKTFKGWHGCLYVTGAKRTTSTTALEIITGIVLLAVYIKREAVAACFRLKLNSQWVRTIGGHTKIKEVLAMNVPLSPQQIDHIAPKTSQPLCRTEMTGNITALS